MITEIIEIIGKFSEFNRFFYSLILEEMYLWLLVRLKDSSIIINPFMMEISIIQNPVHWSAEQICRLVSIW